MSNPSISTERQRQLLKELAEAFANRSAAESRVASEFAARTEDRKKQFEEQHSKLAQQHEAEMETLQAKYVSRLEAARLTYETESKRIESQKTELRDEADLQRKDGIETAELSWRQARDLAEENFEQDSQLAAQVFDQARATVQGCVQQFEHLERDASKLLRRRDDAFTRPEIGPVGDGVSTAQLLEQYATAAQIVHQSLQQYAALKSVRFVDEGWPVLLFFLALPVFGMPIGLWQGWAGWQWAVASLVLASVTAIVSRQLVNVIARRASEPLRTELKAAMSRASAHIAQANQVVIMEERERKQHLAAHRDHALTTADQGFDATTKDLEQQHAAACRRCTQRLSEQRLKIKKTWDEAARESRKKYPALMEQKQTRFDKRSQQMTEERHAALEKLAADYNEAWDALIKDWRDSTQRIFAEVDAMNHFRAAKYPDFSQVDWATWTPSTSVPPAVPFGQYVADLSGFPGGLSEVEQLRIDRQQLDLPAVLAFPDSPSLLIEAEQEGRDVATRVIRNVMLRLLTALPAGKVRFTIIDPTGLGQNFSAFMHLADFDERLITSRIWTESSHINQRLSDLTEHMENVIQKYLRNEFASIQAYNEKAGEVAEPFQVLVVANFPANFGEEAARRLVSIATSGARCGVFTLISADTKMKLPRNFDLADLETHANTLCWQEARLGWKNDNLQAFALTLDEPPADEQLTVVIKAAGRHAKDANRVEVPFSAVVPPKDQWWSFDSRQEIEVPLGRAGATQLQTMRLGKGTSQHVLMAGKTGSGKSTLMHALITNLAIHYSPDELQFYLVDFKKGVEFKTYAQLGLPHALVVAIESEREFGLSVLQRLDAELHARGDRFRAAGVQSLAAFRDANPKVKMSRLLLLVDEFQEFFVKDDKISQEASLLLDRLVRQGRAFGIHVLLGSQTLAGAYSLARSTIGQMAVRIALQCSEADAHLILSEENTAARLLSRPGEAIYNNANGLFEGNHPFQVVWLPDAERESYLRSLVELAEQRDSRTAPPIIFEGNEPARLDHNHLLLKALCQPPSNDQVTSARAWLGAAIAIKDPTDVVLRRQTGNHLLIVGQDEEMASGILTGCVMGLAASLPTRANEPGQRAARFYLLDGGGFDSVDFNFGARLQRRLPLDMDSVEAAQLGTTMSEIDAEVQRRLDAGEGTAEPIFLVIYNLARFRDLRKSEDDFGLSGFGDDQSTSPGQQLAHIFKEGPSVGVHVLCWCDTYNNVTRWFDRATLRDISWRVLFQMSATDSSNLMDSAAASQLGANRAIVYSDERGEFEKFRPYGVPTHEFLDQVANLLSSHDAMREPLDGQPSDRVAEEDMPAAAEEG